MEEKQAALIRRMELEMPELLRGCTFDNFIVEPHTRAAFAAARRMVARNGAGRGLMFLGDVGTGKTHLAAAIANAELAAGRSVMCGTVPDLLSRISASWDSDKETEAQVIAPMLNCSLLVLDDLGTETVHPWVEERMYRIINHRYTHGQRLVITANVSLEAVQARYDRSGNLCGQRLVSRFFEMCEGVLIKGPDYRRRRGR